MIALCAEAARRINVEEQMLRARRSLNGGEEVPSILLGLTQGEELEEATEMETSQGNKKIKYQETYEGVPVMGATVVLEKDRQGHFSSKATGHVVADINEDLPSTEPQLSAEDAFKMIVLQDRDDVSEVRFDPKVDAKLEVILEESNDAGRPTARLAYQISYLVENEEQVSRPFTLIDANTGDIIKQWNGLSVSSINRRKSDRVESSSQVEGVGGNEKIGKVMYGKNYPKLKVNNACVLENNVAKVYNCWQGSRCGTGSPFTFDCDKGFDDSVNGAYSPMNDALFYITATYEMFDEWYGIKKPLQRPGTNESFCQARVHYGRNYENAFWDGKFITFGDGYRRFYPLTSINVVAHEIAHGITEMNSGLIYRGESGGMNEAFSDMAGEAVEFYASKKQDWMVGYEIFKDPEKALRYFKDPAKDGKSIGYARDYCPGMDPHYSSGLFNRVFYYLGNTTGWDVKTAFHPFVVANKLYWKENSRFYDAACGVVQAARDLGMNADDVIAAFKKAGVKPCVDNAIGLRATASLSAEAGEEVLLQVDVTDSMQLDHMSIEIRTQVMTDIMMKSPSCQHCKEAITPYSSKKIEICSAKSGIYQLSLIPREQMWSTAVAFFGASVFVFENGSLSRSNRIVETSFEMPSFVTENDLEVMLELNSQYGYVRGYVRFGEKPDMSNYKYDYSLRKGSKTLLCYAKPGKWYVTIKTYDYRATGISVELQSILTGKRVQPSSTTLSPEGSGSGDTGSGNEGQLFF